MTSSINKKMVGHLWKRMDEDIMNGGNSWDN